MFTYNESLYIYIKNNVKKSNLRERKSKSEKEKEKNFINRK